MLENDESTDDSSGNADNSAAIEYTVSHIVDHKRAIDIKNELAEIMLKWNGDPNELLFRVHWTGYGTDEDTWEPLSHVFFTQPFLNYFRQYLIPTIGKYQKNVDRFEVSFRFKEPRKCKNSYYLDGLEDSLSSDEFGSLVREPETDDSIEFGDHDETSYFKTPPVQQAKGTKKRKGALFEAPKKKKGRPLPPNLEDLNQDNLFGDAVEINESLLRFDSRTITTDAVLRENVDCSPSPFVMKRKRCRVQGPRKSKKQKEFENLRALAQRYKVQDAQESTNLSKDGNNELIPESTFIDSTTLNSASDLDQLFDQGNVHECQQYIVEGVTEFIPGDLLLADNHSNFVFIENQFLFTQWMNSDEPADVNINNEPDLSNTNDTTDDDFFENFNQFNLLNRTSDDPLMSDEDFERLVEFLDRSLNG